jgi:phospholipid/cholesterol/gamma-HCH transport system ATP-binding protein
MTETSTSKRGISVRNAWFRYSQSTVLTDATLEVQKGDTIVVTGSNGSGKSTLLYVCAGLVPLQRGTATIAGHRPDPALPSELMRRGVRRGFVFQEGGLITNMNALANVALPLRYHADVLGITLADVERRAKLALGRVGISDHDMYSLPGHLSFGVRKRVALARAIAIEPNFFFFDDPDVGLDPKTAALVHEILTGYRDDPEVTTVVATNRDILIDRLAVKGYVLVNGRVVERQSSTVAPSLPRALA